MDCRRLRDQGFDEDRRMARTNSEDMVSRKDQFSLMKWLLLKFCLITAFKGESEKTGGKSADTQDQTKMTENVPMKLLPENLPSITDIKKAIPKHCFEPKVSTSMSYVALDAIAIVCLHFAFQWIQSCLPWYSLYITLPVFWFIQGTFFTAIFVLGHDCGHDSFSKHGLLNDTMGTFLHTFLMIPYYCWKLSHRIHHKNTSNIDKDDIFYPEREKDHKCKMTWGFGLGVGWYIYIVKGYGVRGFSHYNLFHSNFARHFSACCLSVALIGAWCAILYQYALFAGWFALFCHYIMPLLVFSTYGMIFTFLHHSDEGVPWYSDHKWDFVRGQLSTIDRDYGYVHGLTHNIGTHQVHHLFTKVPHYHLIEATSAFRKAFPDLVRVNRQPIIPTFIKMFSKYAKQHVIGNNVALHTYR